MAKYKIIYDRKNCTGIAVCSMVAEKFWIMNQDDKADLVSSANIGNDIWERIIEEDELKQNLDAARSCPVRVIKIVDEQNKEVE